MAGGRFCVYLRSHERGFSKADARLDAYEDIDERRDLCVY